jgi:L-fuconolactonase
VDDIRKYIEHAATCFGFDRIIFGGDWPVVNLAGSYQLWADAFIEIFSGEPEGKMKKLLKLNADKAYKL